MTSVTLRAQQYSQRKLRLKRRVVRRLQKTGSDCADVTWCGSASMFKTVACQYVQDCGVPVCSRLWRASMFKTVACQYVQDCGVPVCSRLWCWCGSV